MNNQLYEQYLAGVLTEAGVSQIIQKIGNLDSKASLKDTLKNLKELVELDKRVMFVSKVDFVELKAFIKKFYRYDDMPGIRSQVLNFDLADIKGAKKDYEDSEQDYIHYTNRKHYEALIDKAVKEKREYIISTSIWKEDTKVEELLTSILHELGHIKSDDRSKFTKLINWVTHKVKPGLGLDYKEEVRAWNLSIAAVKNKELQKVMKASRKMMLKGYADYYKQSRS